MAVKKSVRLSDETQQTCELLTVGDINWSGSINSIVARYNYLIGESTPYLSEAEKAAYYSIYQGHNFNDDIGLEMRAFNGMVVESLNYDSKTMDILNKNNISAADFLCHSIDFSYVERLAIIDMTQRYWNNAGFDTAAKKALSV